MPRKRSEDDIPLDPDAEPEAPKDKAPSASQRVSMVKRDLIQGGVESLNLLLALPLFRSDDMLTKEEIDLLVKGADAQQKTSPFFRKWLNRYCAAAGGATFIGAVALVVFVRLQRHGVLPDPNGQTVPEVVEQEPLVRPIHAEDTGFFHQNAESVPDGTWR